MSIVFEVVVVCVIKHIHYNMNNIDVVVAIYINCSYNVFC